MNMTGLELGDTATEQTFHVAERQPKIGMVRLYGLITIIMLLVYGLIIPLFFSYTNEVRFTLLLIPMLVILGGYIALTFWDGYVKKPQIDFACLLAVGALMLGENYLLWDETSKSVGYHHANIAIHTSVVTAFASIIMSDRVRWFFAWFALHATAFLSLLVLAASTVVEMLFAGLSYLTGASIALFIAWSLGRASRVAFALRQALEAEQAKTEELLFNILPESAVRRLKGGEVVADSYPDASVIFIDLVGFTSLAARASPGHLIEMLNSFFNLADRCAASHGVEKVKTIGDAYLAIAGGNLPAANSADTAIAFSQTIIDGLADLREATGLPIEVRIGIHTGPVVGGVIGSTRMVYDYWGETLNLANRIEGAAQPNGIAISESTFLRSRLKRDFSEPEIVTLKGVGPVAIYRMQL
jgi:adenylate cyclase